jgi:hypothetical protein
MSLAADPRAALIAITTTVVRAAEATGPAVVAAPDPLSAGDVLEDEELCRKEIYSELNLATR